MMIGVFGVLGVLARYYLGIGVFRLYPHPFPFGTFLINILGSFLIGLVFVLGIERNIISENLRVAISVGFLGGFTTFSAYSLEAVSLFGEAKYGLAFMYFSLSPVLGCLAAFGGIRLARLIF
jgi:fluoride exporter